MKKLSLIIILVLIVTIVTSCSQDEEILNPDKPTTITVWHYYHGQIKEEFDNLVAEFNATVGKERGIVIDAKSHSDVGKLGDAVYNAANENIGSQPLPDIFAAYPENAFRVNKVSPLVDLEEYFSKEELDSYRQEFIAEGRFGKNNKLMILPIAKSTEILYLNKTDWDQFAAKSGVTLDDLETWEGIAKTAKKYYKTTGESFFSIDSNANFMLLSAMQLGEEIYDYQSGSVELNFSKELAKKIWEVYYIPYLKDYFKKVGRFSSDDARTGVIISYTGSTAGAMYFPQQVALSKDNTQPIEVETLPYPHYKNGKPYVFQQGAGMVITESNQTREYAASLFLKWFTKVEQNIEFSLATGYFPVKDKALKEDLLLSSLPTEKTDNPAVAETIKTALAMFEEYKLYTNKPFEKSYRIRRLLETHLFQKVQRDKDILESRVAQGEKRSAVIAELTAEEEFEKWYQEFKTEAASILSN